MAVHRTKTVRLFLRASAHRLEEATFLSGGTFSLSAVYLAGYAVECGLKALVLSQYPEPQQATVLSEFMGRRGHDFDWLRGRYRDAGGPQLPRRVVEAFAQVAAWSTALRYEPRREYRGDEEMFFAAVRDILDLAVRRVD